MARSIQESVAPVKLEKIAFSDGRVFRYLRQRTGRAYGSPIPVIRFLSLQELVRSTVGIPCDRCLETVAVEISACEFKKKLDMKLSDEERVNESG